ncbi:MAG TPA: HAMP domain-containing sensor histidine kinase [Streptosporangiaceae bacterium]|nr:HAMP domain-containing sensor histidine kinase [Streptosporangiaceae bacterium]
MARRIALIVVALVTVLLGTVAIPLGLLTAAQDRHDFQDEAIASAATVASVAEEHLDERSAGGSLARSITEMKHRGDQVAVYDSTGRWVAGDRSIPGVSAALIGSAITGSATFGYPSADRLLVVRPVGRGETSVHLGVVVLSRSTEALDHRVAVLWAWLTLVSVAGVLACALTATALARWVSRPLSGLEAAAQRLGSGEFDARSPARYGPREVRRLAANFNLMAARLEALVSGHQAMMADVSHQLRTPLAALRLRLDVLALQTPGQLADELAGAQEEVARLSRMVDGLLAVARAENVTTTPVPVRVETVIKDRAAAWLPAAEEKSVYLTASAIEPVTARLGEGHLEQILDNLLANALDAVPAGGRIRVGAVPAGSRVQIVVADDGPGMSPQQQRAAFRRYVSATPGGTGLGLAIVHRLVTSNGGTAELSDTPGGGLTVTLDVPAMPRDRIARRPGAPAVASRELSRDPATTPPGRPIPRTGIGKDLRS